MVLCSFITDSVWLNIALFGMSAGDDETRSIRRNVIGAVI